MKPGLFLSFILFTTLLTPIAHADPQETQVSQEEAKTSALQADHQNTLLHEHLSAVEADAHTRRIITGSVGIASGAIILGSGLLLFHADDGFLSTNHFVGTIFNVSGTATALTSLAILLIKTDQETLPHRFLASQTTDPNEGEALLKKLATDARYYRYITGSALSLIGGGAMLLSLDENNPQEANAMLGLGAVVAAASAIPFFISSIAEGEWDTYQQQKSSLTALSSGHRLTYFTAPYITHQGAGIFAGFIF